MAFVAEIFKEQNGQARLIGQLQFEVPPQKGDELFFPNTDKRVTVRQVRHLAARTPRNEPTRMNYQILIGDNDLNLALDTEQSQE